MRKIIIMRGLPGSGKSTWIKQRGLEDYTLCPDKIRKMLCNPIMSLELPFHSVNQGKDEMAWSLLFKILEMRMREGQFTVIDATTLTADQFHKYKELIKKYKYRTLIVDFTDMPLEDIKEQNRKRWNSTGFVPEYVLDKLYKRWEYTDEFLVSKQFKVIKPADFYEYDQFMCMPPLQLDEMGYKKVVFIGDIHGCWSALNNYFKDETPADHPENFYIFLGDYLDRGFENVEVFKHLLEWKEFKNVLLLEGNHETHWKDYVHDNIPENSERIMFYAETLPELLNAGYTKKDIARLSDRLGQCAYLQNKFTHIFACHAGIKGMMKTFFSNENPEEIVKKIAIPFNGTYYLTKLNTRQMTHGIGRYSDVQTLADQWEEYTEALKANYVNGGEFKFYQIFGHRNFDQLMPIQVTDHVYDLECGVYDLLNEKARLRIVEYDIEKDEMNPLEIFNPKWNFGYETTPNPHTALIKDRMLKMDDLIRAKHLHDNVYAFNFTQEAWFKKGWNNLVCKARGLFLDVEKNEVVARSYDKFFNYKERRETKELEPMLDSLHYPVQVFEKYNGFLGILSVYRDELLFCTKSEDNLSEYRTGKEIEGDERTYSNYMTMIFKKTFEALIPEEKQEKIKNWLAKKNCSMLFEVCDPTIDPHIVPYDKPHIVLLDIVYNDIEQPMTLMGWESLKALNFGVFDLELKKMVKEIKDKEEMRSFVESCYGEPNINHEGFVCKDKTGYMIKFKTADYIFWKAMRSMFEAVNNSEYGALPTYWRTIDFMKERYSEDVYNHYRQVFDETIEILLDKFGEMDSRSEKKQLPSGFMDSNNLNLIKVRKIVNK